jgi:hypothetical protein
MLVAVLRSGGGKHKHGSQDNKTRLVLPDNNKYFGLCWDNDVM